jgi:hypothetical protein
MPEAELQAQGTAPDLKQSWARKQQKLQAQLDEPNPEVFLPEELPGLRQKRSWQQRG